MPRTAPRYRSFGTALSAVARAGCAVVTGAVLLHLIEFHIGLGPSAQRGGRLSSIAYAVQHCPLFTPSALILLVGLGVVGATVGLLAMHWRWLTAIEAQLPGGADDHPALFTIPVSKGCDSWHVARLWLALTLGQSFVFVLSLHAVPMHCQMVMAGVTMDMSTPLPVPLWPLTVALALLGSFILTYFEREFVAIALALDACLRALFGLVRSSRRPDWAFVPMFIGLLAGLTVFSRPPPLSSRPA